MEETNKEMFAQCYLWAAVMEQHGAKLFLHLKEASEFQEIIADL